MSRAKYSILASLLALLTAGLSPPCASAASQVTEEPTPPARPEALVPPALDFRLEAVGRYETFAPDTLTGTVSNIHTEDATIQVITGMHLALRLVTFRVIPETRIQKAGESIAVEQLTPGDVVRIDYRGTAEGNVANAISVVAVAEEGGAP